MGSARWRVRGPDYFVVFGVFALVACVVAT